jgi:hypothetical protein
MAMMQHRPDSDRLLVPSDRLAMCCLGVIIVIAWWTQTHGLEERYAWLGWSPAAWVHQLVEPAQYAKDFPAGYAAYRFSAFMNLYPEAYRILGILPENLIYAVIAFEIVLIAVATWLLSKSILPGAATVTHYVVVILAVGSWARNMDLSLIGAPFFMGLYYNAADGLRLLAIACVLRERFLLAAILLGLSSITHPLYGMTGAVFIGAYLLAQPTLRRSVGRLMLASLLFAVITIPWLFKVAAAGTASHIPVETWKTFTEAFSWHFYPIELGLFSENSFLRLLPLLSFSLLLVHYAPRIVDDSARLRGIGTGLAVLALLTICGALVPVFSSYPPLIKLALHRASALYVTIGLVIVSAGLLSDIVGRTVWFKKLLALTVLGSPFLLDPGFPLLISILLVLYTLTCERDRMKQKNRRVEALLVIIVALVAIFAIMGYPLHGIGGGWRFALGMIPAVAILALLQVRSRYVPTPSVALVALFFGLTLYWHRVQISINENDRPLFHAFFEAQQWARDNTAPTALFMVDPSVGYGWREFSHRSSFGTLHEWLHTSWLYEARTDTYEQGLRRFGEFDVPIEPYLQIRPSPRGLFVLLDEVRARYHAANDDWRLRMARTYGIDYFVLRKADWKGATVLRRVYENGYFVVLAVR